MSEVDLIRQGVARVGSFAFSPQSAEAMWRDAGIGMPWLEHVQPLGRILSVSEAIAFVATRDLGRAAEVRARMCFWAPEGELLQHEARQAAHVASLREAVDLLHDALLEGRVTATGIRENETASREIPAAAWSGLSIGLGDGFATSTARVPGWRYLCDPVWIEVRFTKADIVKLIGTMGLAQQASDLVAQGPAPGARRPGAKSKVAQHVETALRLIARGDDLLGLSDQAFADKIAVEGDLPCSKTAGRNIRAELELRSKTDH